MTILFFLYTDFLKTINISLSISCFFLSNHLFPIISWFVPYLFSCPEWRECRDCDLPNPFRRRGFFVPNKENVEKAAAQGLRIDTQ